MCKHIKSQTVRKNKSFSIGLSVRSGALKDLGTGGGGGGDRKEEEGMGIRFCPFLSSPPFPKSFNAPVRRLFLSFYHC
jgi:hypothetical protein